MTNLYDRPPIPQAIPVQTSVPSAPPQYHTATYDDFPDQKPDHSGDATTTKHHFEIGDGYTASSSDYAPLIDAESITNSLALGITSDPTRGDPTQSELRRGEHNGMLSEMAEEAFHEKSREKGRMETRVVQNKVRSAKINADRTERKPGKGLQVSDPHEGQYSRQASDDMAGRKTATDEIKGYVVGDADEFKVEGEYKCGDYETSDYETTEYKSVYD